MTFELVAITTADIQKYSYYYNYKRNKTPMPFGEALTARGLNKLNHIQNFHIFNHLTFFSPDSVAIAMCALGNTHHAEL